MCFRRPLVSLGLVALALAGCAPRAPTAIAPGHALAPPTPPRPVAEQQIDRRALLLLADLDENVRVAYDLHAARDARAREWFSLVAPLLEQRRLEELSRYHSPGTAEFEREFSGQRLAPGVGRRPSRVELALGSNLAIAEFDGQIVIFDSETGDPRAWDTFDHVTRWGKDAFEKTILLFDDDTLYDATARRVILTAKHIVWPKGDVAYVFDALGCHWHIFDVKERRHVGDLDALPKDMSCDGAAGTAPFVTSDGKWLASGMGRWSLATRRFAKHPHGAEVISPDGRYVAYFEQNSQRLVLHDLVTERRTSVSDPDRDGWGGGIANGHPLFFASDPPRLEVFNYSKWTFEVPSMKLVSRTPMKVPWSKDAEVPPEPVAFSPEAAAALAKLEARSCHVADVILPRFVCE